MIAEGEVLLGKLLGRENREKEKLPTSHFYHVRTIVSTEGRFQSDYEGVFLPEIFNRNENLVEENGIDVVGFILSLDNCVFFDAFFVDGDPSRSTRITLSKPTKESHPY